VPERLVVLLVIHARLVYERWPYAPAATTTPTSVYRSRAERIVMAAEPGQHEPRRTRDRAYARRSGIRSGRRTLLTGEIVITTQNQSDRGCRGPYSGRPPRQYSQGNPGQSPSTCAGVRPSIRSARLASIGGEMRREEEQRHTPATAAPSPVRANRPRCSRPTRARRVERPDADKT